MLSRIVWQQYWSLSRLLHQPKTKTRGVLQPRQETKIAHHDKAFAHHGKYCTTVSRQHSTASPIKAQVAWEYFSGDQTPKCAWGRALCDVQRAKLPKCVIPAAPPQKGPDRRTLGFSRAQTSQMYAPSCSRDQSQDQLGARFLGLSRAQTHKICTPSCSATARPRSLGSTHVGTFRGSNSKKLCT